MHRTIFAAGLAHVLTKSLQVVAVDLREEVHRISARSNHCVQHDFSSNTELSRHRPRAARRGVRSQSTLGSAICWARTRRPQQSGYEEGLESAAVRGSLSRRIAIGTNPVCRAFRTSAMTLNSRARSAAQP